VTGLLQQSDQDLGIHEVLGTSQADESDFRHRFAPEPTHPGIPGFIEY